jgi:type II secretory pathway component PulF
MALTSSQNLTKKFFGAADKIQLYRELSFMLRAEYPLQQAIDELYWSASKRGKKPNISTAIILQDWGRKLRGGREFADAIGDWISPNERMIIESGKGGDGLAKVLDETINMLQGMSEMCGAVIGSMIYPTFQFLLSFMMIYIVGTNVIPEFMRSVPADKLTGVAASLMWLSYFAKNLLFPTVAVLFVFVAVSIWSLPRLTGSASMFVEGLPPGRSTGCSTASASCSRLPP